MRRAMVVMGVVLAVGVLSRAAPAPQPPQSVAQKLSQRVKFDGIEDPKATLTDALDKLGQLYDVTFDVNEKAFKFESIQDVGRTEIASPEPLRPMRNVRLSTLLRKVLGRVPVPSGATFLVRADHIEITTGTFAETQVWGNWKGPKLPLVNAVLEKSPFDDAVKELAEQADFNVLLDTRAADKGKTAVSARLINTPLDTAVRLLADMADLRSVQLDNVLYVTTKENAAAVQARIDKELGPNEEGDNPFPRKGRGRDLIINPNGGM